MSASKVDSRAMTSVLKLSQINLVTLDETLQAMYKGAPPPLPGASQTYPLTPEEREDEPPPAKAYSGGDFLLSSMPPDLLKELYAYIALPFVARLVCRAMRDAHPERTEVLLSHIVKSQWTFMWAYRVGCPFEWSVELSAKMARHGAMGSLRWAHMNGMPRDRETCYRAARCGHLETLKLACATGCPIMTEYVAKGAAIGGHVRVLEWLHAHYAIPWDEWTTIGAARHGQLAALQWLREKGCKWNSWCIVNAAIGGHLHVIEWARANGCRLSREAMVWAARNGHMHVVTWLRQNGCNWNAKACMWAAKNGHFEVLQWLRVGYDATWPCPWCAETCWAAASGGHLEILEWCMENDCPATWTTWAGAALAGHLHVLRWLHRRGWKRHPVSTDSAVKCEGRTKCHEDTVRWMKTMDRWDRVRAWVASRKSAVL